jgi:hypothetical protein
MIRKRRPIARRRKRCAKHACTRDLDSKPRSPIYQDKEKKEKKEAKDREKIMKKEVASLWCSARISAHQS